MSGGAIVPVIGLLVWTFRGAVKGQAARVLAVASMILLLNEAFLGALLVKLGYVTGNQSLGRVVVLSIHLSNTLLLLAALTLTARLLGTSRFPRISIYYRASQLVEVDQLPSGDGGAFLAHLGRECHLDEDSDELPISSLIEQRVESVWKRRDEGVHLL